MSINLYASTDRKTGNTIEVASINSDDSFMFAVRNSAGLTLNKDGEWEYEPSPSNRDDDFLSRCRFNSFNDAANALEKAQEAE